MIVNNSSSASSSASAAASGGGSESDDRQVVIVKEDGAGETADRAQVLVRTGVNSLALLALSLALTVVGWVLLAAGRRSPGRAAGLQ